MLTNFDIFKTLEADLDPRLPSYGISVMRLDGVRFSKLTKQFEKPFSIPFEEAMNEAAIAVLKRVVPNALLTYVASDEISFILSDKVVELPYSRRIQKLTTVAASTAGLAFHKTIPTMKDYPAFDARAFILSEPALIREYVTWRRLDCRKNATSMAAGHLRSHKELAGVSTKKRGELLASTEFEKIPDGTFNGRFILRNEDRKLVAVPALRDLAEKVSQEAMEKHLNAYVNDR